MRLPAADASSSTYLSYASYVEGALEGWKRAETITDEQSQVVAKVSTKLISLVEVLHAKAVATEATQRATRRARARYSVRDVLLDLRVMATSDAVLNGPAARQRQHPVYQQLFQGMTASDITKTNLREEPEVVARLRDRLFAASDFAGKAELIAGLDLALSRSFEARESLLGAEAVESRAVDAERLARSELRQALEESYGLLRAAFVGHRDLAESFFPRVEPVKAKEAIGSE